MVNVVKMILDSVDESSGESQSVFAEKLLKQAKRHNVVPIPVVPELSPEAILSLEMDNKIKRYKENEKIGDLIWMEYSSWNSLTPPVKREISQRLDPLFWSGVYFSNSAFRSQLEDILKYLDTNTAFYIFTEFNKNHKIVAMHADFSVCDWLGVQALRKMQTEFKARAICGYGVDSNGTLIRKEFNGEQRKT